jgi:hypothetical protein
MSDALDIFLEGMNWLKQNYASFRFFLERDVVWTVQKRILETVENQGLPYRVFNDYPILPGVHRSISSDLAILDQKSMIELIVEFKYEPAHERQDICTHKLPVVFPNNIEKDIARIEQFAAGKTETALAIFIDEGGHYRSKLSYLESEWEDLEAVKIGIRPVSILWSMTDVQKRAWQR